MSFFFLSISSVLFSHYYKWSAYSNSCNCSTSWAFWSGDIRANTVPLAATWEKNRQYNLENAFEDNFMMHILTTKCEEYAKVSKAEATLKTLVNIVEDRLNKMVELWCLCGIMVFRRVNKQPGKQKFWNWCSHYQEIYDWISPLNKRSGWPFILTQ